MDNKEVTQEGGPKESHSLPLGSLRREMDSLDDFEHLGHDSSPLKESGTGDLLSGLKTAARDELGMINKGDDKAATAANPAELSSFDPLQSALFDRKMDSNLLEMGDNFPDRKEGDAKLDKFLEEMTSFAPPKHEEPPEIPDKDDGKTATQHFMDVEREPIQPKKPDATNDLLEKYSDSEPDNDDDFKPSKYEDFPKKAELPESFGSTDNFKTDAFKDLDELEPQLPQKDYPLEPAPAPPKEVKPEPVKTTPEPAKKLPEKEEVCKADSKPKKAAVIDAEAIFCKMGLGMSDFNPGVMMNHPKK
jgi:hypothetical protein